MATAREESNPYGGLGAGGKFRKKPFRRPQSTPYDRPQIRNPTIVPGANGNGWLRKLMDPAHKLLASTAQRFYASLFRKRLTQAPPSPLPLLHPPENKLEAGDKNEAAIPLNVSKEQEAASDGHQKPIVSSVPGEGSSMDFEEILRQKTFTRSEIDRLTALLRARVVENPVEVEEKMPDVFPSKSSLFQEREDEVANLPLQDDRSRLIPTKALNSSVLDEDLASPAELAKAYMGSRPSKVSPSMLGLRGQALAEDSTVLNGLVHSSQSPILSIVPSPSGHVGVRENGYATPRSRGRSAIYSMARSRTPYSRVHVASTPKSSGPMTDGYGGPLTATQALEHNRIPGSAKALKRSSSIFENGIGSGGPLRRIRQKPNLSYQKNWSMPTSVACEPSSSTQKMHPVNERKLSIGEQSNIAPVSSKSTEMASKILEQLDKIVSPPKERSSELKLAIAREKAPAKLSPSKLQGQALKSLKHIDSSKFLEFARDNNKPDNSVPRFSHDSGETSKEKQGKFEQTGPLRIFAASDKPSPSVNDFENAVLCKKDAVLISTTGDANLTNSLPHIPAQKKRPFKMSAPEDYLDLEDDGYPNGVSSSLVEVRENRDTCTVECKTSDAQATIISGKHQTVTDDKPSMNFFTKETSKQGADGKQVVAQTHADNFPSIRVASTSSQSDLLATQSTSESNKAALLKDPAPPLFSAGDKVGLLKEQNVPSAIFGFASNNNFTANSAISSLSELSSQKIPPDSSAQSSISVASDVGGLFSSSTKMPESDKAEEKKTLKDGAPSGLPEGETLAIVSTSSPTFTSGIKSASSNGSTFSSLIAVDSNAFTSQKPFSIPSLPVTFSGNNSSSTLSSIITATASNPALPTFKFESAPSNSVSQASSPVVVPSEEGKTKADMGSGNILGSTSLAANSTSGSSIFGFGAASAISNANYQKEGSATTGAANGSAQVPESTATGTGLASFTHSVPVQFGSSSSSGQSTTIAALSTSSLFGSSSATKLFSSGTMPSSEPSSVTPRSSSAFGQANTTTFASSLTSKSESTGLSFGSSPSSSNGFIFGSAPGSSASSSAPAFGLSGTSSFLGSSGTSSVSTAPPGFGSIGTSSASTAAPVFGTVGTSSASTAASVFGSMGSSSASTGASVFGSTTTFSTSSPFGSMGASSGPTLSFTGAPANTSSGTTFSFTSSAASPAPPPAFGNSNSPFIFGSPSPANNNNADQMSMEDSMAEDMVQANHGSTPPTPSFGQQQPISAPAGFVFGSNAGAGAGANPFQFGAQQNLSMPQSPSPFQATGSQDFNAGGGSFSLGTGGDKSGRRIIKVKHKQRRK
ncbi:nuclear pore complex protein NUP1 isoform X1 [Punica granatum]|uniref:Nuclear pore complex protein NUP1 isoform X1 n=1 Tax=Punica granatum TaxID=22663 RepID=A0A6P8BTA7_PUNGR|nr:nuclear pore complex protein NUP1 isoform X1 [Punica granatum]